MSDTDPPFDPIAARDVLADLLIIRAAVDEFILALQGISEAEFRSYGIALAATSHLRSTERIGVQVYLPPLRPGHVGEEEHELAPWWVDDSGCLHYANGFLHARHGPRP